MWFHVLVAIVPSAVIGLPLDDWMTEHLHNPPVVSAMLILYGVFFLLMESTVGKRRPQVRRIDRSITAWLCSSVCSSSRRWCREPAVPGATILGAMLIGCSRTVAAEFTFFLAVPHHGGSQSRQGRQVPGRRRRLFRL